MRAEAGSVFQLGAAHGGTAHFPPRHGLHDPRRVMPRSAAAWCGGADLVFRRLVARLRRAFGGLDLDGEWPWPEDVLTYENALLPHALIVAGRRLADPGLRNMGLQVLDWLIAAQTSPRGVFSPIGSDGWWPRGGTRSRFDQQPIEATATILAAAAAYDVTGDDGLPSCCSDPRTDGSWVTTTPASPSLTSLSGGCHDGLSRGSREHEPGRRIRR